MRRFWDDLIFYLSELLSAKQKETAVEAIYNAEFSTLGSGASVVDILKSTLAELGKNKYIESAIAILLKGKPHNVAFRGILPNDIVDILKSAEGGSIPPTDIFKTYIPMKEIIQKAESKIRSALMEPLIIYMLVGGISFISINNIYHNVQVIPKLDLSTLAFIRNYYAFILVTPMAALYFALIKFPDYIPIWNKVYRFVQAANYLLITKTIMTLGMSSVDVIRFLRQAGDVRLVKRIDDLKRNEQNMGGVTKALSYYLFPVEIALLKTSVKYGTEKETIATIVEKRLMDVDRAVSKTAAIFNNVLKGFAAMPILLVLYAVQLSMSASTSLITK
jgi:hypothetical protein